MKTLLTQFLPLLLPLGAAITVLLAGSWWRRINKDLLTVAAVVSLVLSIFFSWRNWLSGVELPELAFPFMIRLDNLALVGFMLLAASASIAIIASHNYLVNRKLPVTEYLSLILFAVFGGCIMACGTSLIVIFIGLEVLSLPAYVLAGYNRSDEISCEASIKYFILGAVAGAILLFGIAFYYGATGTIDISFAVVGANTLVLFLASGFIIAALCFKVAAVPFQWWAPDVYQGSPLPVTTFFATTVKAAAFIAFLRIINTLSNIPGVDLSTLISVIAVATMIFGNLAALFQEDMKRMLAYSSIAHAGYMLLAFVFIKNDPQGAQSSLLFYLLSYMLMTAGAFTAVAVNSGPVSEKSQISDLAGLGKKDPWIALLLSIFLISLAGFPPTAGFLAKFYIFRPAIQYGYSWIVIIAVLSSLVSVYYYMRPVVAMYFGPEISRPEGKKGPEEQNLSCVAVTVFCAVAVIALGILPSVVLSILAKS